MSNIRDNTKQFQLDRKLKDTANARSKHKHKSEIYFHDF